VPQQNLAQGRLLLIVVEAEAIVADAPDRLDCRRLEHQSARAAHGERAELRDVPVAGDAVDSAVIGTSARRRSG
jgi:hypothetical protein